MPKDERQQLNEIIDKYFDFHKMRRAGKLRADQLAMAEIGASKLKEIVNAEVVDTDISVRCGCGSIGIRRSSVDN